MTRKAMGTMNWAATHDGAMSKRDRLGLIRNLAFVQVREISDAFRQKTRMLPLPDVSLDRLQAPTSAMANDALAYAEETHSTSLLFHSWRTYYFGRLIAAQKGYEYDDEIFFVSAILHDLGLTTSSEVPISSCCFAVQGARMATTHLEKCGYDHSPNNKVADAIALHLNIHVSRRLHGPEAHMVTRGATCDLFGFGRRRISHNNLKDLFTQYPREGVVEALKFETATHFAGSRPDFLTRLSKQTAPKTPFYDATNFARSE